MIIFAVNIYIYTYVRVTCFRTTMLQISKLGKVPFGGVIEPPAVESIILQTFLITILND